MAAPAVKEALQDLRHAERVLAKWPDYMNAVMVQRARRLFETARREALTVLPGGLDPGKGQSEK